MTGLCDDPQVQHRNAHYFLLPGGNEHTANIGGIYIAASRTKWEIVKHNWACSQNDHTMSVVIRLRKYQVVFIPKFIQC